MGFKNIQAKTEDDYWIPAGKNKFTYELDYYIMEKLNYIKSYPNIKTDPGTIFINEYAFKNTIGNFQRASYDILDLIGDLGGVLEMMIMFFGLIFFSVSYHSFNLSAFKKLFLVKTHDNETFEARMSFTAFT